MTTAITIPDEIFERLRSIAEERHTSVDALVREALEEKALSLRPLPSSLGAGDSGYTNTARESATFRPKPTSLGIGASGYTYTYQRSTEERPEPRSRR